MPDEVTPLSKESDEKDVRADLAAPFLVSHIVYSPQSSYNDKLMGALAKEIFRLVKSEPKHHRTVPPRKLYGINDGGIDLFTALTDADGDEDTKYPEILKEKYQAPKLVPLADDEAVLHECEQILNQNSTLNPGPSLEPLCLALSNTSESADIVLKVYAPVSFVYNGLANFELGSERRNQAFDQAAIFLQIIQQEHLKLQSETFPDVKMNYNEHQGVMGLSDAEFFWGHFLTCLIIGIVESVIVVIVMTRVEYEGTTYAHGIDASLLTVSFIIFQIGLCLMIILITWVFPKGWVGLIFGLMLVIIVPGRLSRSVSALDLPAYFLQSKLDKILASLLPHSAFFCVIRIILIARI
ncbi:hypothetical protein HPB50_017030 [Hyalomma asiaticum]|uniref:Uncharacterized protein n=1 Tax=Hyalomma asiaticum TaxID=266040 RepID=A0ACB7RL70_HYAAI|nr:hypothetical protein HPB50_017030 [Hyalomma asiaticum]